MARKTDRTARKRPLEVLIEAAEDCAVIAKAQRASADSQQAGVNRQHESARKLEILSGKIPFPRASRGSVHD